MRIIYLLLTITLLASCGTKVPYTKELKKEFNLTPEKLSKVQFYSSETIILERSKKQNKMTTTSEKGDLVSSSVASSERIVIPANRRCIFEKMEKDGSIQIRFELGPGRVLSFATRQNISNGRLYLKAMWKNGKGELDYGGAVYYAVRGSASAYLMVRLKNYKKNKRKDRVVKGLKVK